MAHNNTVYTTASVLSTPRQRQKPFAQPAFSSRIQAALEHANRLTEMHGIHHIDTVVAWEAIKALLNSHPYFSALVVPDWRLEELG